MKNIINRTDSSPVADKNTVEVWKVIPSFLGQYEISNLGRVLSHPNSEHKEDKVLKTYISKGSVMIKLSRNKVRKPYRVAYLVANAFVSNPHHYRYIRFIDGNELNVNATNLEWVKSRKVKCDPAWAKYLENEIRKIRAEMK